MDSAKELRHCKAEKLKGIVESRDRRGLGLSGEQCEDGINQAKAMEVRRPAPRAACGLGQGDADRVLMGLPVAPRSWGSGAAVPDARRRQQVGDAFGQ